MFVKERMSGWLSSLCCIQSLWFILERLFLFFLLIHCLEYTSVHPCRFSICLFKSLYLLSLWNNSLTTFSDIFLSEFYRSLRHPSFGTRTECNQVPVFHCFLGLGLMAPWKQGVGPYCFFFLDSTWGILDGGRANGKNLELELEDPSMWPGSVPWRLYDLGQAT